MGDHHEDPRADASSTAPSNEATRTNGPATGAYHVGDRLDIKLGTRIRRADVAHVIVTAAHDREWIHRNVVITT